MTLCILSHLLEIIESFQQLLLLGFGIITAFVHLPKWDTQNQRIENNFMQSLDTFLQSCILAYLSLSSMSLSISESRINQKLETVYFPAKPFEHRIHPSHFIQFLIFLRIGEYRSRESPNQESQYFLYRNPTQSDPYISEVFGSILQLTYLIINSQGVIILSTSLTYMQETIKLLGAIDTQIRKQSLRGTPKSTNRKGKFPFAKVLDFGAQKFDQFPKWLTQREDFLEFMYNKYESKLLSIPKICEKDTKASDQKYFVSLYLEQIPIFQNLPHPIKDILLNNIRTKYYAAHTVIHEDERQMEFMAVIFIGSVSYHHKNDRITKIKNDVIMTQAFYGKTHPQIVAKEETVLLTFSRNLYGIIQQKLMDDINQKSRDQIADLIKSDFFIELHLKDKKARSFFGMLKPEFYFKGEHICNAGDLPQKFFIIFRGRIKQLNQIYIRQHNKWPLQVKRWEVRAVYNAFQNAGTIKQYNFFGDEEIINALRLKSTYIAQTHSILFSMNKQAFIDALTNEDFKRLKKYRNQHININYSDFQKSIRDKVKSEHERKKIIHKAIDTSFAYRNNFPNRRMSLVERFEKQMLTRSIHDDLNTTMPE